MNMEKRGFILKKTYNKKILNVVFIIVIVIFVFFAAAYIVKKSEPKNENVFDCIYYQVEEVKKGNKNVLVNGTQSAYADYDFGFFENIQIPELDMCLTIENNSLHILFFNRQEGVKWNTSHPIHFRYDLKEKQLYGERSFEYLAENFFSHYFKWFENDDAKNEYSMENLGNYTFTMQENVNWS